MVEVVPLMVRELLPDPASTAPVTNPPLIVTVSAPLPADTEPMAPAPLAMLKVLLAPSPRLREPVRPPDEAIVAVSEPAPRVRCSRSEKQIDPKLPAFADEIFRL